MRREEIVFAIVGCGRISINHVIAAKSNHLKIAALCDVVPSQMEALLERQKIDYADEIARFADYKELVETVKPNLVAIATESGSHAEIALYCIERGISVIIEKPMAMSMCDAEEIVKRSEEQGVAVSVCHQNRFNEAVQAMRQALEKGRFGKISHGSVHVRWNRDKSYYDQAKWRGKWEEDGGCLMNQCIHGIDLLRWMMGDDAEEIYGMTRRSQHSYIDGEDVGLAVVKFKSGNIATIEGTVNVYPKNLEETLCLFGETGTVKLGGVSINSIDVWNFSDEMESDEQREGFHEAVDNVYGNGHTALYRDVVDSLEMGRKPYVDAIAGKNAVEMVLAVYKSQKAGAPVKLPLKNFSSGDMKGEFS